MVTDGFNKMFVLDLIPAFYRKFVSLTPNTHFFMNECFFNLFF